MFSVRIVTTDHYMAPPIRGLDVQYADQRGAEVKKVPVVRIFGATPAGNCKSQDIRKKGQQLGFPTRSYELVVHPQKMARIFRFEI